MSALADKLRAALKAPPSGSPIEGDHSTLRVQPLKEAAVLIAITDRDEPGVLLTLRREHLRAHAGQIAFPGGHIEPGETGPAAALREANEEILLDPAEVDVIGSIENYRTVTNYIVTPVLGVIPPELPLLPHEHEVAELFEAPLGFLLDAANQRLETALLQGRERRYYEIIWEGRRIWGATAGMIVNLSRRLKWR